MNLDDRRAPGSVLLPLTQSVGIQVGVEKALSPLVETNHVTIKTATTESKKEDNTNIQKNRDHLR